MQTVVERFVVSEVAMTRAPVKYGMMMTCGGYREIAISANDRSLWESRVAVHCIEPSDANPT